MVYAKDFSLQRTPQREPIPGREADMVVNSAGGYVFPIDDWKRLDRFLVLGAEGGTYYTGARKLTQENAAAVMRCIAADGKRVVKRTVEISQAGRAPKNDPAIFVLALCASEGAGADKATRRAAFAALPDVCRIFTHLAQFLSYAKPGVLRGRGRGLREAVAAWYNDRKPGSLAYQMAKYRNRHGWTHADALRVAHPKPPDSAHDALYGWAVGKKPDVDNLPNLIRAYEAAQLVGTEKDIASLIVDNGLTREMVPTKWLKSATVWEALLYKMPMMAMVRNLGKMTSIGLLAPLSQAAVNTAYQLDSEAVAKAKVHPFSVLVALRTYQQGKGMRGKLTWDPVARIVDALDAAYYHAFGNVESTGKRIMLALDVSGSMTWSNVAGLPLTPRVAAAAMAMVTARTEPSHVFATFSTKGRGTRECDLTSRRGAVSYWDVSPRQRLDDICTRMNNMYAGGTDCALPMLLALKDKLELDAFVVYTDNETWAGEIHPTQALQQYRREVNSQARLAVVGMTATKFSIADPNDAGTLDVVGFDTATPQLLAAFIGGQL